VTLRDSIYFNKDTKKEDLRLRGAQRNTYLAAPQHCYMMILSTKTLPSVGFVTGRATRNRLEPVVRNKILPSLSLSQLYVKLNFSLLYITYSSSKINIKKTLVVKCQL
jgi:hypothetical protein